MAPLIDKIWAVATAKAVGTRTVTLKLESFNFAQITRVRSLGAAAPDCATLAEISLGLLRDAYPLRRRVRLLGVSLSPLQHGPVEEARQLGLMI